MVVAAASRVLFWYPLAIIRFTLHRLPGLAFKICPCVTLACLFAFGRTLIPAVISRYV